MGAPGSVDGRVLVGGTVSTAVAGVQCGDGELPPPPAPSPPRRGGGGTTRLVTPCLLPLSSRERGLGGEVTPHRHISPTHVFKLVAVWGNGDGRLAWPRAAWRSARAGGPLPTRVAAGLCAGVSRGRQRG